MTYRKLGALVAAGAIALAFATNEAIARSGGAAAPPAGATVRAAHASNGLHGVRHRGRGVGGYFWPGYGDAYDAYLPGAGPITAPFAGSNEVHYTTTYDVPWDWVHRFPPNVIPSDRPYVPGCTGESVDVGAGKTVNVMRCY